MLESTRGSRCRGVGRLKIDAVANPRWEDSVSKKVTACYVTPAPQRAICGNQFIMKEKIKAGIIMLVALYASYKLYTLGEFLINANT